MRLPAYSDPNFLKLNYRAVHTAVRKILAQEILERCDSLNLYLKRDRPEIDKVIRELAAQRLPALLPREESRYGFFIELVVADSIGLGPLDFVLEIPELEAIEFKCFDRVEYRLRGADSVGTEWLSLGFYSEQQMLNVMEWVCHQAGGRIDEKFPHLSRRFRDKWIVEGVLPPVTAQVWMKVRLAEEWDANQSELTKI